MKVSDFDYKLPQELIAQHPIEKRDNSRLLVLDKKTGEIEHSVFHDIIKYLKKGDCLVLNNTKVIPARLFGVREKSGAEVEVLLLKKISLDIYEVLTGPGRRAKIGDTIVFGNGELKCNVLDIIDGGNRIVEFIYDGVFEAVLDKLGQMPLPHYITEKLTDKTRYQTVYAKYDGSAAAPTAGLHFTDELLQKIADMGVNITYVTLHVGLGTFRPVKVEDVYEHTMHSEEIIVPQETCDIVNKTKQLGGRVIAIGTTAVRTLESMSDVGVLKSGHTDTSIFIYPGYKFKIVDAIVTNFHLPKSTLIMLISAFAGMENIKCAYQIAIEQEYRFFSFGDAMLIL